MIGKSSNAKKWIHPNIRFKPSIRIFSSVFLKSSSPSMSKPHHPHVHLKPSPNLPLGSGDCLGTVYAGSLVSQDTLKREWKTAEWRADERTSFQLSRSRRSVNLSAFEGLAGWLAHLSLHHSTTNCTVRRPRQPQRWYKYIYF